MTWFDEKLAAGDLAILFKVSRTIRRDSRAAWEARTLRRIHQSLAPNCADDLTARRQVTERLEIGCEVKTVGGASRCLKAARTSVVPRRMVRSHLGSIRVPLQTLSMPAVPGARAPVAQLSHWAGTLAADRRMSAEVPPEDAAEASFLSCRGKGRVPTDLMRSL
ncbi:hypothetical protein [Bradyrhizobium zhanjiangense]|uniref:hypothetical protein n=1 Tax=Bradyrhizobium zhanjiangense TaxID=1325107 RepID=UPI001008CFA0|nr:hypothetical protein [Bradyrhizobium zhanjiangense]